MTKQLIGILTDGHDVFSVALFECVESALRAEVNAKDATDGNIHYCFVRLEDALHLPQVHLNPAEYEQECDDEIRRQTDAPEEQTWNI